MSYKAGFCPKLRAVDVLPFDWQGQKSLLLRDPWGYAEGQLVLPAFLGPLLGLMDGRHSLRELQVAASRLLGRLVMLEELEQLVKTLDQHLFLEGERFESLKERREEEFSQARVRAPSHAGQAYPAEPEALKDFLEKILGLALPKEHKPRALIAPHIDLSLGAKAFAAAYQGLRWPKGARVIVLGTGHFLESLFSLLDKDFETPLGVVPCDREFCGLLYEKVGAEIRGHAWAHRSEHSIEFQVLFLQYLLEEFTLVPLLVGSPELFFPAGEALAARFISALRELIDENTYLVAGVDFCHLGVRYGDPTPAGEAEKKRALEFDRRLLHLICDLDASGFYHLLAGEGRAYKVCGFGPLYFLLRLLEGQALKGQILFQEVVDFGPGSIVSFASAAFYQSA